MWIFVSIATPTLLGLGWGAMQMINAHSTEFRIARACFWMAGIIPAVATIYSITQMNAPAWERVGIGCVAAVIIGLAEGFLLNWVAERERRSEPKSEIASNAKEKKDGFIKPAPQSSDYHELIGKLTLTTDAEQYDAAAKERAKKRRDVFLCIVDYGKKNFYDGLKALQICKAEELENNGELLTLCNELEKYDHPNPLAEIKDHVPQEKWLDFLKDARLRGMDLGDKSKLLEHLLKQRPEFKQLGADSKPKLDLRFSVLPGLEYNDTNAELSVHIQFCNHGTAQRTILSVTFGYRDPDQIWKNSWEIITPIPGFLGDVKPISIGPATEHVETFKSVIAHRYREKAGGKIGLLLNATDPVGAVKHIEVEILEISRPTPEGSNRIAYTSRRVSDASFDV